MVRIRLAGKREEGRGKREEGRGKREEGEVVDPTLATMRLSQGWGTRHPAPGKDGAPGTRHPAEWGYGGGRGVTNPTITFGLASFGDHGAPGGLEAGVDGFGFEGEDAEDALVGGAEGLAADEAFEGFDAEGEFAGCEGTLGSDVALAEALEVVGEQVLRAVDDAEVFGVTKKG